MFGMCQGNLAGADGQSFLRIFAGLGSNFNQGQDSSAQLRLIEFGRCVGVGGPDARGSWLITLEYSPQSRRQYYGSQNQNGSFGKNFKTKNLM